MDWYWAHLSLVRLLAGLWCGTLLVAQPMNLLFLGDSLTQGVPHVHGEVDTYPFLVAQQFPGSTYTKLGYRGQPTDYLLTHLDGFLFGLLKTGYQNVLVVWGGTNDCALGPIDCAQPAYTRLMRIARAARAAGWKVFASIERSHQRHLLLGRHAPVALWLPGSPTVVGVIDSLARPR